MYNRYSFENTNARLERVGRFLFDLTPSPLEQGIALLPSVLLGQHFSLKGEPQSNSAPASLISRNKVPQYCGREVHRVVGRRVNEAG